MMVLTSNRMTNPATAIAKAESTKNARIFNCPEVSNSKRRTLQHTFVIRKHRVLNLTRQPHRASSSAPAKRARSRTCLHKVYEAVENLHIHVGIKGAVEGEASQEVHRLFRMVMRPVALLHVIL